MCALFRIIHNWKNLRIPLKKFEINRKICSVVVNEEPACIDIKNEPILEYLPESKERKELLEALKTLCSECQDIPIVVGTKEIRTSETRTQKMPHNLEHNLAKFYYANKEILKDAIRTSVEKQKIWDKTTLTDRIKIWMTAADLMAGKYRQELNAATMLGQSKTVIQAEIDAAAELIDFFRFNAYYLNETIKEQPYSENIAVTKNSLRHRGFDGFVAAISPFNFTAIGGNLSYTPALMGNGVVWKPSDSAILSNWVIFKIMREAGMPPGVVNFVPADGPTFAEIITNSPFLSAINFTGSVSVFEMLWKQVAHNISKFHNFPRLIGECGGKNFHFIHPTADVENVTSLTLRSAFEYSGQKCSACSRVYVPESMWPTFKECLLEKHKKLNIGDVQDFQVFTSAVINKNAFERNVQYIEMAKFCDDLEIIGGGTYSCLIGYFVDPTIIVSKDPRNAIMVNEIFGPILTIYVYKDKELDDTMELVTESTKYALTGAVFAEDMDFLTCAYEVFKMSAGNFYINDKSTGSIVGQQPFGGGRKSGTNDKAGWKTYIHRWSTLQSVKETFVPMVDIEYPYMASK